MSAVIAVIAWYASGALAAWLLVRRGHSASLWAIAAALVGGLVLVALVVSVLRPQRVRLDEVAASIGDPDRPLGHRLAVWLDADEEGPSLARSLGTVPIRPDEVCLIRRIGFEANSRWIDTGERSAAARQVRWIHVAPRAAHRRFLASGPVGNVSAAVSAAGAVSFHVLGARHRRRLVDDAEPLLHATGIPVVVLPDGAIPAPRSIRPRPRRELAW